MRKAPVLVTVIVLLVSAMAPLASAQDEAAHGSVMDGELAAFAQGYVENLVLWSGAGIGLANGPSFGGNSTLMAQRIAELETAVAGTMPPGMTPILVPWISADPAYGSAAPINHSTPWTWNASAVDTTVGSGSVGTTLSAESALAALLLEGDRDGKLGATEAGGAEGVLLVLAVLEAVDFVTMNLGWNGSAMVPLNLSDPNMTDMDPSNGWWLPAATVTGSMNGSVTPPAWEPLSGTPSTIDSSLRLLEGIADIYGLLVGTPGLMGDGEVFPASAGDHIAEVAAAVYWNVLAVYQDNVTGRFHSGDGTIIAAMLGATFFALDSVATHLAGMPAGDSAAGLRVHIAGHLLELQRADGTLAPGYTVGPTGVTINTGTAGLAAQARATAALYTAHQRYGGVIYGAAARACLRAFDATYWNSTLMLYVRDPAATDPTVPLWMLMPVVEAIALAAEIGGVELAKHRLADLWTGIQRSGMQLSETSTTGEDYSNTSNNDTDGDMVLKHDTPRGEGRGFGIAPMLAQGVTFNVTTGNWTVSDAQVPSLSNMEIVSSMIGLDAEWAATHGTPVSSEHFASMLLHSSEAELAMWMEERAAEIAGLEAEIAAMQSEVDSAVAEAASLRENISMLELDLNDSLENESVLNTSVNWLRNRLEEANGTVENLTKDIDVLDDRIERLGEDLGFRDENVTRLKSEVRSERSNVTQLKWQLANSSVNLTNAQRDLAAAQKDLVDTQEKLDDQEGRTVSTSIIALIAGFLIALVLVYILRRVKKTE